MEPPDYDDMWRRIVLSPLRAVYLEELHDLAATVVHLAEEVFLVAPKPPKGGPESYLKVDHDLMTKLYFLLGAAARIRALLTERARRKDQSAKQHAIQIRRAAWLRDEVLNGIKLSEILSPKVRHSLEHFDEYLDDTGILFLERRIPTPALMPIDFAIGRRNTLEQFQVANQRPHVYFLKVYIASERVFVNCGHEISIQKLHTECRRIAKRLRPLVPPAPSPSERGSQMLVVTPNTF
jgi:hypothetical protein